MLRQKGNTTPSYSAQQEKFLEKKPDVFTETEQFVLGVTQNAT